MCTLGHTCTGGCICTLEKDAWGFDVRVNAECPVAGHTAVVVSAKYSPDGMRIVSGSHDGLVIIWDAANGAEVCREREISSLTTDWSGSTISS